MSSVSVITLTRNRPDAVARAARSVAAQKGVEVEHVVVADRCEYFSDEENVKLFSEAHPGVRLLSNFEARDSYLPSHLATLRYWAGLQAGGEYVAYLDDDNEFEADHCAKLVDALIASASGVGHSWRTLWMEDGSPYLLKGADPWLSDPVASAQRFRSFADAGVYVEGTNTVRDEVRLPSGEIGNVDTSEWFFSRDRFVDYGRPVALSDEQRSEGLIEDQVLTRQLAQNEVTVARSASATLRYSLGGYSNTGTTGANLRTLGN